MEEKHNYILKVMLHSATLYIWSGSMESHV